MHVLDFTLYVWIGALAAGLLGALTGLGGGVVLVPFLTLVLGVDIRYAIGASLVSVIATSSGAAAAYVREGFTNIRIGMFLELATTLGALGGAFLAGYLPTPALAVVFGVVLVHSAYLSGRRTAERPGPDRSDSLARRLRMDGTYPTKDGPASYHVTGVPGGAAVMLLAGILSGLLGIGSGAVKVLAMDRIMRLPFKVSTTTSNFMIGVTAAAGAGIYLHRGNVDPGIAMPVILGVLPGSMLGARFLMAARTRTLRIVFAIVILVLGIQMIVNGLRGWR